MSEETFIVTVDSPYGEQPIEQFRHHLLKVADEADTRWGIDIDVSKSPQNDAEGGFDDG